MILTANETIAVIDHDFDQQGLSRFVERDGTLTGYDPRIREVFCAHIPVGGTVVDGGAFIGDHTVAYADKVGDSGHVWAFEPWLPALQCLYFNVACYPHVHVVSAALASARGRVQLMIDPRNGGATAVCDESACTPAQVGIPAVPLDEFVFDRLDFLKLDLEGFELRALQGATLTLAQHRPIVIVESGILLSRYGDSHQDLLAFMRARDYTWERLPLLSPGGDVFDVLFTPKAHA